MHFNVFKYKFLISVAISLVFVGSLAIFISPPKTLLVCAVMLVVYLFNVFSLNFAIYLYSSKFFVSKEKMIQRRMKLVSEIKVVIKGGQQVAQFTLQGEGSKLSLEIETTKGMAGNIFTELNIDRIMIKPNKEYLVNLHEETRFFKELFVDRILTPVSIDYYDLQEVFCLYSITLKAQVED